MHLSSMRLPLNDLQRAIMAAHLCCLLDVWQCIASHQHAGFSCCPQDFATNVQSICSAACKGSMEGFDGQDYACDMLADS